jgi:hypothetical protein
MQISGYLSLSFRAKIKNTDANQCKRPKYIYVEFQGYAPKRSSLDMTENRQVKSCYYG